MPGSTGPEFVIFLFILLGIALIIAIIYSLAKHGWAETKEWIEEMFVVSIDFIKDMFKR